MFCISKFFHRTTDTTQLAHPTTFLFEQSSIPPNGSKSTLNDEKSASGQVFVTNQKSERGNQIPKMSFYGPSCNPHNRHHQLRSLTFI